MKSGLWKIATVFLAFLILLTMGVNQSFVSYNNNFYTTGHGANGTVIVVAIEGGMMVHGQLTVFYQGAASGNSQVVFPNGTSTTVNSSLHVNFDFGEVLFPSRTSKTGGPANLSISPSHPIAVGIIYDVPSSYLNTVIGAYNGNGINCYGIFVQNFSLVRAVVVGGF